MTDEEVMQLYRCLLGRDPEDPGTVAAFKSYYPTVERGRRAMFTSKEFELFFARATGRTMQAHDNLSASLALMLLSRAAAAIPASVARPAGDPAMRAGMTHIFPDNASPRLAVVVGQATGIALEDMLPFRDPDSAILHIAPGFPPVVPLAGTLDDATAVFRLNTDPDGAAELLSQFGRPVNAVCLLGTPASAAWVHALQPHLAERALVLVGPGVPASGRAAVDAAIDSLPGGEPVQHFRGNRLHHIGGWLLPVTYEPPRTPPALPDLEAYPALAIAAIVRNEAICIENMLRSALPVASFYAVLDTGSDDGTPGLVESFLAGCGVPFAFAERSHHAFGDHFADMRNAAMAMVPARAEWVLMLDADEELVPEDYLPLLELIAEGAHDAYALPRYNFSGADKSGSMLSYPDRQVRLLRHTMDGRIAYSNAVHETVRNVVAARLPLDQSAVGGPRGGPHIHHLVRRFRTPQQEDRKQAFYREIAERQPAPPKPDGDAT